MQKQQKPKQAQSRGCHVRSSAPPSDSAAPLCGCHSPKGHCRTGERERRVKKTVFEAENAAASNANVAETMKAYLVSDRILRGSVAILSTAVPRLTPQKDASSQKGFNHPTNLFVSHQFYHK
jgi:hypothetical protein